MSCFAGVMMGTSVDAIDVAICRIAGDEGGAPSLALLHFHSTPIGADLRERILRLCRDDGSSVRDVCRANRDIGAAIGEAVADALKVSGTSVICVGSHGQTVWHEVDAATHQTHSTLQIGDASVIAARLGVPVASDFRVADVASGGNGAPFAPIFDDLLLRPTRRGVVRALLNVGGIANVAVLDQSSPVLAWDCGPGGCLIDRASRLVDASLTMDRDGLIARSGRVFEPLLERLLALPFFALAPPKSTGRELFSEQLFVEQWRWAQERGCSARDFVATLTELTARGVADSLARFAAAPPTELFVAGGGARNVFLLERLAALLPDCVVASHDVLFDGAAKEAALFALLAFNCWHRRASLPNGAVLGKLAFPPQPRPGVGRPTNAL